MFHIGMLSVFDCVQQLTKIWNVGSLSFLRVVKLS